jgi:hypothetical protein
LDQCKSDRHRDELATKRDLKDLELNLESRLAEVRRDIKAMKAELLKWLIGLLLAPTGLIADCRPGENALRWAMDADLHGHIGLGSGYR